MKGPLNLPALERAFNEVVRRHESLRTTFTEMARPSGASDRVIRAPAVGGGRSERTAGREPGSGSPTLRLVAVAAFDRSGKKVPWRGWKYSSSARTSNVVLVGMHHIIYDGWSMEVLSGDLLRAYRAFAAGLPSPLAELPHSIRRFRGLAAAAIAGRSAR